MAMSGWLRGGVGLLGLKLAYDRLSPEPAVYVRTEVSGGKYDRDPPKDPKQTICVGTVGFGPMNMKAWRIKRDGRYVQTWAEALDAETSFIKATLFPASNDTFDTDRSLPCAFKAGDLIPVVTVRPKEVVDNDTTWCNELLTTLHKNKVTIEIEYEGLFLDKKKEIPVLNPKSREKVE